MITLIDDAGGHEIPAEMGEVPVITDSFRDVARACHLWLVRRGLASADGESRAAKRCAERRAERGDISSTYSPPQFAVLIGKTRTWVNHQIRTGLIKSDVRYGSVFIPASELPRYLATLSNKPSK